MSCMLSQDGATTSADDRILIIGEYCDFDKCTYTIICSYNYARITFCRGDQQVIHVRSIAIDLDGVVVGHRRSMKLPGEDWSRGCTSHCPMGRPENRL